VLSGYPCVIGLVPCECDCCRRLRSLDPHEEQFSKLHEKLLLLQISHRQAALTAMHAGHIKPSTVRLPDLHAANLFLQAHQTLQVIVN
jgi:hypothetical protein